MPDYMDEARLNTYFYVTDSEIYQISPYIEQDDGLLTFYNDDTLLMSILDTDEKLIGNGELICCLGDVEDQLEEGEVGTHISIEQQGKQIFCNRVDIRENEDPDYYENFIWEEGVGLVGYQSGYDAETWSGGEFVYLENIIYGTTEQAEDKEIVCENPYFFPQDVSALSTDLIYDLRDPINNELELHWLKQYNNGCLVRLTVVPFDDIPLYMDMTYFIFYFYVTPDEIYRIHFHVATEYFNSYSKGDSDDEINFYYTTSYDSNSRSFDNMDAYINHNDKLIMSVLNTDERLMEYGELIFSLEEVERIVEEGPKYSIRQEGGQVVYSRTNVNPYNIYAWEGYRWEKGLGLVEYHRGFSALNDTLYLENIMAE